jgi:hypothetical protein
MRHQAHPRGHGHHVKLNLSHAQIRKAKAGHPIQLKHSDIGVGHGIHVHPETHKKLVAAHKARKGARIHLTHHELAGAGFLDVLKSVASPVLSGIAGVAGELFPSHKDTINKVREGVRTATGYGIKKHPKKKSPKKVKFMHGGDGLHHYPHHYPGHRSALAHGSPSGLHHSDLHQMGYGINPSGFY